MKQNYSLDDIKSPHQPHLALLPFYIAFMVVAIIIGLKTYAYAASGATSLLASLIDSIGDLALSFISFLTVRLSLKPADAEHRFGHGKAEGFSTLFQSCFLFGAAIFLLFETGQRFFNPVSVSHHILGISVSAVTVVLTLILIAIQKRIYRTAPSLALKADQQHYTSDVLLNGGVMVALAADFWGGLAFADLMAGFIIAAYMMWCGFHNARDAVDMLMDKEIDAAERQKIIDIVEGRDDVFGIHDLRTRKSGMQIYISFDIELDAHLSLEDAHAITREIDLELLEIFPNAEVIIHKDPKGDTYDPRHKVHGVHH